MGRRKKSNSGGVVGGVLLAALVGIAMIPKEIWIGIGVFGLLALVLYAINKSKRAAPTKPGPSAPAPKVVNPIAPPRRPGLATSNSHTASDVPQRPRRHVDDEVPVSVSPASQHVQPAGDFALPRSPLGVGPAVWIPAGQTINVVGLSIPGGMLYFGSGLSTPHGGNDPCVVNPAKSVDLMGSYTVRHLAYWPNYADITPVARGAYLKWLAGGRADPSADIGYVFLFFYGLERRAIIDAATDDAAKLDWPSIAAELRRLLSIYGEKSGSFQGYATGLLQWVNLAEAPERLYERAVPAFARSFDLPFYVKLSLGQAAKDGSPVPAHLALAWVKLGPSFTFRTAATRCPDEFDKLFLHNYSEVCGEGMTLPRNKTKLKLVYRPASSGFRGYNELSMSFNETPDVTALKTPLKQLVEIVEMATSQLDAFSRAVGKNPGTGNFLETLVHLPVAAWPASAQKGFAEARARIQGDMVGMSYLELLGLFGCNLALSKEKMGLFVAALEAHGLGLEPDLLGGARLPKLEDPVVLFAIFPTEKVDRLSGPYLVAALTLQLASAVAAADGVFSDEEVAHLRDTVLSWSHLAQGQTKRLLAHLRLLRAAPASLPALAKKLEPLDAAVKETIGAFMATVAQADGVVSPDELKMLERIYKILGIESKKVFTDVHAAATGTITTKLPASRAMGTGTGSGFKLDLERIATLQRDTERVSSMLANIFAEVPEDMLVGPSVEPIVEAEPVAVSAGLMGLDEAHTALVRMLLSRPDWTRQELQDLASDLELMLDGALERINEAAFDTHDVPLTEGDDPITVNTEFMEKVHA